MGAFFAGLLLYVEWRMVNKEYPPWKKGWRKNPSHGIDGAFYILSNLAFRSYKYWNISR